MAYGSLPSLPHLGATRSSYSTIAKLDFSGQPKLTAQEALTLALLAQQKNKSRSFFDEIKSGAGSGLSWLLNKAMRPSWAINSALDAELSGHDVGHALGQGWSGKSQLNFGDVLKNQGILTHHNFLRGAVGFLGDVVTDPTTLAMVAAAPATGGTSLLGLGAKVGAETATKEALLRGGVTGVSDLMKLDPAKLLQVSRESKDTYKALRGLEDPKFAQRAQAAGQQYLTAKTIMRGRTMTASLKDSMAMAGRAAKTEFRTETPHVLQARIKVPFSRYTGKVGPLSMERGALKLTPATRLAPKAPSLAGLAARNIPLASAAARGIGSAMVPGFKNPILHAIDQTAAHQGNRKADDYVRRIRHNLSPFDKVMTPDEQFQALQWGEKAHNLLDAKRRIVPHVLHAAPLDLNQKKYVAAWHAETEHLRVLDHSFGLHYDGSLPKGLYVPHLHMVDDRPFMGGKSMLSMLTRSGFEKARVQSYTTVDAIRKEFQQSRKFRNVVERPSGLLSLRAAKAADRHARQTAVRHLVSSTGMPAHFPDLAKLAELGQHEAALTADKSAKTLKLRGAQFTRSATAQRAPSALTLKVAKAQGDQLQEIAPFQATIKRASGLIKSGEKRGLELRDMTRMAANEARNPKHPDSLSSFLGRQGPAATTALKDIHSRSTALLAHEAALQPKFDAIARKLQHRNVTIAASEKQYRDLLPKGTTKKTGETWRQRAARFFPDQKAALQKELGGLKIDTLKGTPYRAQIARSQTAINKRVAEFPAKLQKLIEDHHAQKAGDLGKLDRETAKLAKQVANLDAELAKLPAGKEAALHGIANPKAQHAAYAVLDEAKGLFGEAKLVPVEVADSIRRFVALSADESSIKKFDALYGKWLAKWKIGVTSVNPGYRMRNTLTDVWNMYIQGVPAWGIVHYGVKALNLMRKAHAGDPAAKQIMDEAYDEGLLSGLFQGDVLATAAAGSKGRYADKVAHGRLLKTFTTAAGDFNREAENAGRLAHYLYRREYEKMSVSNAAQHVRAAHFDYSELTPLESKRLKKIAPFYTWTRKNIPYQIKQLASRPGKVSIYPKAAFESESASGDTKHDMLPGWMAKGGAFKIPGGSYIMPQVGISDLFKLNDPKQFAGMLSPAFQIPAEILTNKNIGTGAPIDGTHPLNPISGLGKALGLSSGTTSRTVRGETVSGPGANPWLTFALGQTPLTNYLFNQRSNIKQAQRGADNGAEWGYFTGVPAYRPDEQALLKSQQIGIETQVAKIVRGLRDSGLSTQPKTKKPSRYQLMLQDSLQQMNSRGG